MINDYKKVMSLKSDNELIEIVTNQREKYNKSAITDAENEIRNRNLDIDLSEYAENVSYEDKNIYIQKDVTLNSRFYNFIIDSAIVYLTTIIIILFFKENYNNSTIDLKNTTYMFIRIFTILVYYILFEYFFCRTIGKYITNTKVVKLDGEKPNFETILGRTLSRFIPFDVPSFFFSDNGFHDRFSDTKLIYSK